MTVQLPAPWAEELAILDPRFAASLGPLLRVLDDLTTRHDHDAAENGVLDGYSGITLRGIPERILASEWALADEFPTEFLRRATGGELLYTAPAYQAERKRGQVAVLVDAGPDQIGAGRLVQLAALIVLHRRAAARGGGLTVGVLGEKPGTWRDGDLLHQLRNWLTSRSRHDPEPAEVVAWSAELAAADEMWLLTGPRLAKRLPGRANMLVSAEAKWDADGATAVRVTLAEITTELALPDRRLSVKALRGAAFRDAAAVGEAAAGLRFPTFASADPRLLARGDGPAELVSAYVPNKPKQASKLRRHRFPGPVLAAAHLGGRLVGLVVAGGDVRAHVIGKELGHVTRIVQPLHELDIDVDQIVQEGLEPVYFQRGSLIARLGGRWWTMAPDAGPRRATAIDAMYPGDRLDEPRAIQRDGLRIHIDHRRMEAPRDARVVLGGHGLVGWSVDELSWTVEDTTITVDEGTRVLGLLRLHDEPTLITLSRAGLMVRAVSAGRSRTLSKWSGAAAEPFLHPVMPWIAVRRSPTAIDVGDLATGEVLLRVRSGS
ncbi:MAG: hypothetical protein ABW224_25295 [Kibdelosporangium sp.]